MNVEPGHKITIFNINPYENQLNAATIANNVANPHGL